MTDKFYYLVAMLTARPERDERGATATEYALLVAGIAIVISVGIGLFAGDLNDFFTNLGVRVFPGGTGGA